MYNNEYSQHVYQQSTAPMYTNKVQPPCIPTKYNHHAAYVPPPLPRACDKTRRSRSSCSAANLSCKICCRYTGFFMRRISKTCSLRCRSQTKFAWHTVDTPLKHKDRSGNVSHILAPTKTNKKRTKTNKNEQKRTCPFGNTVTVKFPKTSVSVGSVSGRMHQGSSFGSWLVTRASFCCAQEKKTQEEKKKSRKE